MALSERSPHVVSTVTSLVDLAVEHMDMVADQMVAVVFERVPEVGQDERLHADVRTAAQDSLIAGLRMMVGNRRASEAQAPPAAHALATQFVICGASMLSLMRIYRVGLEAFWTDWNTQLVQLFPDTADYHSAVDWNSQFMFEWVDVICTQLADVYAAEQQRSMNGDTVRVDTARSILAGNPMTDDVASKMLAFDLNRTFQGFVVWADPTDEDPRRALERRAGTVAAGLGGRPELVVPLDRLSLAVWTHPDGKPASNGRDGTESIHAAVGTPLTGVDGFLLTHTQATCARTISGHQGDGVTTTMFDDVAIAALLLANTALAAAFARRELGAMVVRDVKTDRIAATVQAYLSTQSSLSKAGAALQVHPNTVAYRIGQAEQLIGHPIDERRVELEVALILRSAGVAA